jgi:hypothetical protein
MGGVPFTVTASIAPYAAATLPGGGYEVAWAWRPAAGSTIYKVWDTTADGNYVSSPTGSAWVPGTSFALEQLEISFNYDLNGDGTIGPVGTPVGPDLWQVGNNYVVGATLASAVLLQMGGVPVSVGAGVALYAAATLPGGGYEVAWRLAAASTTYTVWDTSAGGNYLSSPTGLAWVPGTSFVLQQLETSFNYDLSGDGRLSTVLTTSAPGGTLDLTPQTQDTTINLGPNTASASSGLNALSLNFIGTPDGDLAWRQSGHH